MPIYAFECDSCGHQFDRLQKLSDADPTTCPEPRVICIVDAVTLFSDQKRAQGLSLITSSYRRPSADGGRTVSRGGPLVGSSIEHHICSPCSA